MAGRTKVAVQGLTVATVVALLALLVWKVVHDERSALPKSVAGKSIAAPAFELPRLDGKGKLALADLRGKAVVINFFASWCEPCKTESPMLEAAWKRYRDRGLVIVGVDYDDFRGDARSFATRYGLTYPLVHDQNKSTVGRYGVVGVPETLFVDRRGRIVADRVIGELDPGDLDEGIALALKT